MRRGAAAVVVACGLGCACGGPATRAGDGAAGELELGLSMSIYSAGTTEADARARGFAMVVDRRRMQLPAGGGDVVFAQVPDTLDPGSVWFRSLTDPAGTRVLEQSFEHDAASLGELVLEQVGKPIVVVRTDGELRGRLARVDPRAYVLDLADGEQLTVPIDGDLLGVRLPDDPELSLRPTLSWKLEVARGGEHAVELVYAARRVTWWASYSAIVDARDPEALQVALSAWATVVNPSRFRFEDARIELVAPSGDDGDDGGDGGAAASGATAAAVTGGWVVPVAQPVTLEPSSTRQLMLFAELERLPARIELQYEGMPPQLRAGQVTDQYYGNSYQAAVHAFLAVETERQLPGGLAQVYMVRGEGEEPAALARAQLPPTRAGESARLALGQVADVVGSRRQLGFSWNYAEQRINEALEVKISNQRDEPVRVIVVEDLYRASGGARVLNASPEPASMDGKRVTFVLEVPARGTATASYEAIYQGVGPNVTR